MRVTIPNSLSRRHSTTHASPFQSGSVWFIVATQGISSAPYRCNGILYGIRTPTTGCTLSVATSCCLGRCGVSVLKVPTIDDVFSSNSGHKSTPISHEAIRTSPFGRAASPHACFERFAEVSSAQSIELWLYRMYVLMCGAARPRPPSSAVPLLGKSKKYQHEHVSFSPRLRLTDSFRCIVCPVIQDGAKILELLRLLL